MHWLNAQDMEEDKDDDGKAGMEAMSIPSTSFGIVCEARLVFWAFELLAMVRSRQHHVHHQHREAPPPQCFIFGALYPSKSGPIHKHIVKHIVVI